MDERQALLALGAMSQETRLRIVRLLVRAGPEGMAAGSIAEAVGVSASNVSFHLKELAHAGLIRAQPEGRHIRYSADFKSMNALLDYLTENCCQGRSCEARPAARAVA